MRTPAPADLQRWSEDLARDPASLAFLPLARAYRRIGRTDHAVRLTLRGLEAHPGSVEAHALLALLYLEQGDRSRAADEWSIVLRLKPGNFEALRGMGFRYLEQNEIGKAKQHLERAALIRPDDTAVQEALRLIRQRAGAGAPPAAHRREPAAASPPPPPAAASWSPYDEGTDRVDAAVPARPAAAAPPVAEPPAHRAAVPPAVPKERAAGADPVEPTRLLDDVLKAAHVRGVLLLDAHGLVLAGSLHGDRPADDVGAVLGAAVDEAIRTVGFLELGRMDGLLMESAEAVLHVRPIAGEGIAVLAVTPQAPTGWILRTAQTVADRAARYLEVPT